MVFLIDWVGVSEWFYILSIYDMAGIWPGMPFVHVHMAGHARIRVRGVSPYVWSVLRPPCVGGMDYSEIISYMS